jgi:hypothetical protein
MAGSVERTHNPKVAGSNPAPATKKALGVTTDTKGLAGDLFGAVRSRPSVDDVLLILAPARDVGPPSTAIEM